MKDLPVVDVDIAQEELDAVTDVVKSKFLIEGKNARAFEKKFGKFTGSKYVTTVTNGTCALHLALTALDIGPGDEVITTPFTFVASSNSILFNGAIPIFVDVDPNSFNIDPAKIEAAITPNTKAIMPVHIFGNPCDMKAIKDIADAHKLYIIEDCAQAHDARIDNQHTGIFGDIGCFSFYGTKNLVGGEGGALICQDEDLFDKILSFKNHGRSPTGGYSHFKVGYNYRTTDMSAAIMNVQMDRAEEILQRRHRNGNLYRELLSDHPNLIVQKILPDAQASDYIMAPVLKDTEKTPNDVINYLKSQNISSRTIYSTLSYEQPCYKNIRDWIMARVVDYPNYSKVKCPNAEYIARNHFEIPMVSSLTDENIRFIVDSLEKFFK
ncbi:DegT/DnrJ/EryC1/StrS family aminotransferase [Candidatus Lokiarchaeum ossiferum]|uniref:DegT/DnrJ/EryC1/StrS family aminotransferase n=1 Tax=Candidatus Lokiarchaeum ossiferum TaxID=2951803 RepID=UPI00352F196C